MTNNTYNTGILIEMYLRAYHDGKFADYETFEDTGLIVTLTIDNDTYDNDQLEEELEELANDEADSQMNAGYWNE